MSKDSCLSAVNSVFKKRKHSCASIAVDHKCDINDSLVQLLKNEELSDVSFIVDGESVKAHRIILALRSEYFRALLFGGLKESRQHVISLKEIGKSTFKLLLKYIYTGTLDSDEVQKSIFELVYFSDAYCLTKLHQSLIEYIKENLLSEEFVLKAYEVANFYNIKHLKTACFDYIQTCASEVIATESFYEAPLNIIMEVLQNDLFFLAEGKIYKAFLQYLQFNRYSREETKTLIQQVIRFPLLSLDQIVEYLHFDGLFDVSECDKIVKEKCDTYSNYRYVCQKDVNYVVNNEDFAVLKGEPVSQIDIASAKILIQDNGFRKKSANETIFEFSLGKRCLVNHVKTLAYIQPLRREVKKPNSTYEFRETKFSVKQMSLSSIERGHDFKYSYEIYVSPDNKRWNKVTKSSALSYLWQFIYFPPQIVKFLRIIVKDVEDSLVHGMFHLLHLQCFYSTQKFEFDKQMNLIPYFNVAAAPKIPTFYPGVLAEEYYCVASSRTSKEFYTLYSSHKLFEEEEDQETCRNYFLFVLCQDCFIDTIVITLYDKDIREYDFRVECGLRENELQVIEERKKQRSKQVICFQPMAVRFIKIQGTNIHNLDSNEFAILNLEVFKKL